MRTFNTDQTAAASFEAGAALRPVCAAAPAAPARQGGAPRARSMGDEWNMSAKPAATGPRPAGEAPRGWLRALFG